MALAVLSTGVLRATLPTQLRNGDARWVFPVIVAVLLVVVSTLRQLYEKERRDRVRAAVFRRLEARFQAS